MGTKKINTMNDNALEKMYTYHHASNRKQDFSIMEKERGEFLKSIIGSGKKVLDIGCRNGVLTAHFVKGNDVTGIDIDPTALNEAKDNLGIKTKLMNLQGDWSELVNQKFDVIVAGEVLEHLYFPNLIIKKVYDHLNDGGLFIGSVPNAFNLKNRIRFLFGSKKGTPLIDPTHINHFHVTELKTMLSEVFPKIEITGEGKYKRLSKLSPNLFSFIILFVCRK